MLVDTGEKGLHSELTSLYVAFEKALHELEETVLKTHQAPTLAVRPVKPARIGPSSSKHVSTPNLSLFENNANVSEAPVYGNSEGKF